MAQRPAIHGSNYRPIKAAPAHTAFLLCLLLCAGCPATAEVLDFTFESAEQEAHFHELAAQLRCLVCQNQSLADSNADLARDLRAELYRQVAGGRSREDVLDFMTSRYGEFILYKPRFSRHTLLLWLAPFALLATGLAALAWFSRRRGELKSKPPDPRELRKIRDLLDGGTQEQ